MPIYKVQAPDGRILRLEGPEGASEDQILQAAAAAYQPPQEEGFLRQAADIPVGIAKGAVTGVRNIADIFGAENVASKGLRGVEDMLGGLLSAQAKKDQQEVARIMKEAEDKGVGEQLAAAWEAFKTAPLDLAAQGVGSVAPFLLGGAGAQALKLGAAGTRAVVGGMGAATGAGVVKSSIYDAVKEEFIKQGLPQSLAEKAASEAQGYGENFDQIALGALLGGLSSTVGVESALIPKLAGDISKKLAAKGVGKFTQATVGEAATEATQAAQEQMAQNIALQRKGVETPTFRGVAGASALEGILGGVIGGGAGAISRGQPTAVEPKAAPEQEPAPETKPAAPEAAPEAPAPTFQPTATDPFQRELEIAEARERGEIVEPEPAAEEIEGIELDPAVKADIESVLQPGMTEEQARPVVQSIVEQNLRELPAEIQQQAVDSVVGEYIQKTQPVTRPTVAAPEAAPVAEEAALKPVAEPKEIKAEKQKAPSKWPSDIPTSLFRGYGREDYGSAYGMTASPIAGKGKYFAFNEDAASYYGPNIEKAEAPLKNPYVIRDGNQWAKLTKEAGWEFANPASLPVEKVEEMTQRLQNILKDRGYDGMIVYWDYLSPYDIGPNKENYRTLNKVFGVPQAVVFEKTKPTKAAKKESTPVETSRVRYGFDPVSFQETGTYSLVPVDQGGALFKTRQEAQKAKKFQADTRLQAVEGGYTLVQKRPDEIKADLLKAERMRKMPVAKGPLDILQFLASKGGLSPTLMSEISTDKNIRLGNRSLFAAKGKGLNESIAAEMAAEAGYITDDENLFDVINDSIKVKPRYSINDMDQVAEARYEDYLQAIEEAGDAAGVIEQSGFTPENIQASNIKEGKQLNEVAALITHANNLGIDVYGIEENVAARTEGLSQEQYEAAVAAELERAINQAEQGGVSEFGKTADVEEDGLSPFDVVSSPDTKEFKKWSRGAPFVSASNALNHDFKTGKPFVAESFHGTNAEENFRRFSLEKGGAQTAAESAEMGIFSTSEPDIAGVYAKNLGMGRVLGAALNSSALKKNAVDVVSASPEMKRLEKERNDAEKLYAEANERFINAAKEWAARNLPNQSFDKQSIASFAYALKDVDPEINKFFQEMDKQSRKTSEIDEIASRLVADEMSKNIPQRVMPLYVRMANPMVYDAQGKTPVEFPLTEKIADAKRKGHDGVVFKNIADPSPVAVHYVSFDAKDIKSKFNIQPRESTDILRDIVPGYRVTGTIETEGDLQALNEDIRDSKIREYQGLKQRLSAVQKRFIEDKSRPLDNELYRSLYRRAEELKAEIDATKPKRSSPEDFMARAAKALADGDMNRETFDVIDAMFKKNPKFLDGLRLSVKEGPDGAAGQFNPIARIVRLFKSKGAINPGTARHEFAHSMEQMMPADARQKIVDKWLSSLKKAMETDKSEQAQSYFKKVNEFLENPTQARMNAAIAAMPSYEYYQYLNPSEYWAVNAEPLMNAYLGSSWQRFKMSMKGMLEAVKKVFGLNNNSEIYSAFKNAINGERRTTEMLIDYINSNLRIYDTSRRNYANNPAPSPSWDTPPEVVSSKVFGAFSKTKLAYKFQDKLVDLKDVQKAIQKEGREISDASNAYLRETLYHKRVADKVANFLKKDADPLLQEMQKRKVTLDELNKYLHAKFAEERNRHIANINPAFPDGGSGLMTQEARDYLASLPKDKVKDLEAVNSRVRKIVADTQNEMVRMGLETQQTVDAWNAQFPNYVPLFREDVDFVHHGTGMGMGLSSRGPASKAATGSSKDVSSILDSIFEMREKAIVRGEKARVGRALYALAVANPNPNFWLPINPEAIVDPASAVEELKDLGVDPDDIQNLMAEPKVAVVERIKDPVTGKYRNLVVYRVRPNSKFSDNVFPVRINGKDRYIFFNPKEERAIRLSKSLKNLDTEQLDMLTQQAGKITRFIASMSTQYNPIFGMWNFLRDTQGAALNLSTTPLKGQQAAVLADAFRIIPELYRELRAQRRGEAYQSDIADDYRLFSSLGGPTGYRDQFVKLEEKGRIVERRLRELNAGNVRSVVQSVGGWLSDYNDTLENAIRLAAFRKAIDSGMSQDAAAGLAKELTVNFNRKGAKTPGLSAMYAFFNAAIQGNARLLETLKGPAGKKIIAGGILLGVFQSMLLQAFGLGDDEPPEFTKQRNLIIPTGEGQYLMWPMPLGFNFLPTLGRLITESVFDPRPEMRKSFGKILEAFVNSFNPLGGGGFMQTISPTIIDPFVAVSQNKDSFGRPISREDRATNPSPGYLRSRDQASEFSKVLAEILNYMTFGSEYTKGMISPTADDIDYIAGQYLGGVAREAMRAKEFVQSSATGEPIEPHRIPLVGKIVGDLGAPAAVANKFYSNITRLAEHEAEIKGRIKKRENPAEYLREYPEARLFQPANKLENEISKINRTIRELQAMEGKEKQIETLRNKKTQLMKKFNERYDAAAK